MFSILSSLQLRFGPFDGTLVDCGSGESVGSVRCRITSEPSYDGNAVPSGGGSCQAASPAIPNAKGHLTELYSSASSTTYTGFDASGRVTASSQQTPAVNGTLYQFGTAANPGYVYNLAGQITSETYPSGRKVTYDFDAAGRTAHVKNPAMNVTYADLSLFAPTSGQDAYTANGAIQSMTLGNGVVETWNWDPVRLQPLQTKIGSLLTLNYYYCPNGGTSCASNNGNMLRQTISTPALGAVAQDFTYADGFDRLSTAQETNASSQINWRQQYSYDSYGNRAVTSGYIEYPGQTATSLSEFVETINSATVNRNHWTGAGYDGAGNEASVPNQTFMYDAENRLVATTQPNSPAISYAYDGDGQRAQKTVGSSVTAYVYDAAGELVAEYGAATDTGTSYVSVDHLGSTRLLQQSSGTMRHYDYLPFGEDIPAGEFGRDSTYAAGAYPANGPDSLSFKFTGKERDSETGLDYFGARYMSSAQGRFTSPDPIQIMPQKLLDPQQWNMYSYVRNNPLRLVDPTGMYTTDCAQDDKKCNKLIDKFEKARQKDLKSKNENVRNGAGAYGDRGDDNGVVVHVVTGQQMQQAIGVTANGAVVPTPGQDEDRIDVYINKDLGGSDLQRTVAHEGTHVGDDLPFINSFDPDTGKYNPALNITHGQTEFNAFTAGAGVKKYDYSNVQCGNGPCIFGPQDAAKINQFLHNSPTYGPVFNIPVFDPRRWPQQ